MSRVRQTAEQSAGKQLPQGAKTHSTKKVMMPGNLKGHKSSHVRK